MKVIGAGFGRTGTSSLKSALEELGFGPCHHMEEVFGHAPTQIPLWVDVVDGKPPAWDAIFAGYESAVDFPTQHWYREILAHWPDAKVILTVRDAEGWWTSTRATIYAVSQDIPQRWVGRYLPVIGGVFKITVAAIWKGRFGGRFLDKEYAISVYNQYNESVKAALPADKLLVFDVKEGWAPLCRFLGVPVPSTPFPRRNDTAEFRKRVLGSTVASWLLILLPVAVVAGILGWALR